MILAFVGQDVRQGISYYQDTAPAQIKRFTDNIQTAITHLLDWPYSSTPRFHGLRRKSVKGFPYGVWVRLDDGTKTVYIVGIIHDRRDPQLLVDRIG